MGVFYTKEYFHPKNKLLCASVFNFLIKEYIPLCECFSISFNEEYVPLCKLTKNGVSGLKIVFQLQKIHLCNFFELKYIISVQLYTSVIFFIRYTHFCAILQLCDFFTRNIYTSVRLQTYVIFLISRNFLSIFHFQIF